MVRKLEVEVNGQVAVRRKLVKEEFGNDHLPPIPVGDTVIPLNENSGFYLEARQMATEALTGYNSEQGRNYEVQKVVRVTALQAPFQAAFGDESDLQN
ncbi:hypothetical protein ACH5RR_002009 [Cinchona calisaya]|uniref:Uncharacterized protein n=1 Tax=Cinchona calisaya TaxID=153742 RepID=A0ABD3B541_9GENT